MCLYGHDIVVSKLLSLRAIQPPRLDARSACPLLTAMDRGFVGVVLVLINVGGIRAVGGDAALTLSLGVAVRFRRARTLRLVLAADGEGRRSEWANVIVKGRCLLHDGAGCSVPATVSVLLKAGRTGPRVASWGVSLQT